MDDDRLAGTLMCTGGLLGLAGTVSTVFPFSFLGLVCFGLVLPFGGFVYRKRPEARLLAAASLWFAPLGGVASFVVFSYAQTYPSGILVLQGALGLVGSGLAFTGAAVKRLGLRI